jgi:hypothetical protein
MSNRRLREKAEKAQILRENPEIARGISSADVQSRIPNADERKAESMLTLARDAKLARERNATQTGQAAAPTGQAAAPTGQAAAPTGQAAAPTGQAAAPTGGSVFSGVAGRNAGFSGTPTSGVANSNVGFGGGGGSRLTPSSGGSFAETDARKRQEATASGAFGSRAQNLAGRQGLFAEMKVDSAQARERASALGVSDKGFNTAVARMEGVDMTSEPKPAAAPLTGRALAERNIATMGADGAAADYFKRAGAEKAALAQKQKSAFANKDIVREKKPSTAPNGLRMSFAGMFGEATDKGEPPTAGTLDTGADMFGPPTAVERQIAAERKPAPAAPKEGAPAASRPDSLFGAIGADLTRAGGNAKGGMLRTARGLAAANQAAGDAVQSAQRGAANVAASLVTAPTDIIQNQIPGATGEYIRSLQGTEKTRKFIRSAGAKASGVVNTPFRLFAEARDKALNR